MTMMVWQQRHVVDDTADGGGFMQCRRGKQSALTRARSALVGTKQLVAAMAEINMEIGSGPPRLGNWTSSRRVT
jgi:hypothetical protein